jgi:hypothetical protein
VKVDTAHDYELRPTGGFPNILPEFPGHLSDRLHILRGICTNPLTGPLSDDRSDRVTRMELGPTEPTKGKL